MRLRPAFTGHEVAFATVDARHFGEVGDCRFHTIRDSNKTNKIALMLTLFDVIRVVLWERPDVIVSTGAAPGFLAIRVGKLLGARSVWVDSIANAKQLSLSGKLAESHATLWLTQWQHLETAEGPFCEGGVL